MNLKILSLGKFDFQFKNQSLNTVFSSNCYFDWVNIYDIKCDNSSLSENIRDYEKIISARFDAQEGLHVQESMILISEEVSSIVFDNVDIIYVSMINLPMFDEKIITNGNQYGDLHQDIKDMIEKKIKKYNSHINLYYTYDHCDFILLCDGSGLSLSEYMGILKEIRKLTIDIEDEQVHVIHDITTIYGYNNKTEIISKKRCKDNINVVVSLSFKNYEYVHNIITQLKSICQLPAPNFSTDLAGRYDHMFCWENINFQQFNQILNCVQENKENFFASRIHIGLVDDVIKDIKSNSMYSDTQSQLLNFAQCQFSNEKIVKLCEFLDKPLVFALKEIHHSICTMIQRGFAQYYILCFYESFYSFVDYLSNDKYMKMDSTDQKKQLIEKVYDMYRTYFSFLNVLNVSTMHSERQFIQIDSYHIMYFDTPPKLIAFYTAIANKMATSLNENPSNNYTFLITPDFKKDIFVEQLTHNKTMGNEHNILIIHMNEESMYNITDSMKIIAHEIAHHIGQNESMRKNRSEHYIRTFLAWALTNSFTDEFLIGDSIKQKYDFFEKFIEHLAQILYPKDWHKEQNSELHINSDEEILYYTEYFLQAYSNRLSSCFSDTKNSFLLSTINKMAIDVSEYTSRFLGDFWTQIQMEIDNITDKNIFNEFASNKVMYIHNKWLTNWIFRNNIPEEYKVITYVFRESYADARMLMLTTNKENIVESYCDMFDEKLLHEMPYEEQIRIVSVLTYLCENKQERHPWIEHFENVDITTNDRLDEGTVDLQKCFSLYLRNQTVEYLRILNEPSCENFLNTQKDVLEDISAFEGDDINEMIRRIDYEIFEYRKRLLNKHTLC